MVDVYSDEIPEKLGGCEVIKSIGKGTMGQNFLVRDGEFTYVVKTINHNIAKRMSEAGKLTGEVTHNYILPVNKTVADEEYDEIYFTDYLSEMQPFSIEFFSERNSEDTIHAFRKIADAFRFAHENGISHSNFKPSNLMVKMRSDGIFPLIIDFGFYLIYDSDVITPEMLKSVLPYMSPELIDAFLNNEKNGVDFYKKCDAYAFAILFCEALSKRTLFEHVSDFKLSKREKQDLNIKMLAVNSPRPFLDIKPLHELLNGCLAPKADNRLTSFEEILELIDKSIDSMEKYN